MDLVINKESVVVFDLDDTLYNEIDFLKSAYVEIAKKLDPEQYEKIYAKMFAMYQNKINVFKFLSGTYNIELLQLLELYRSHIPEIILFEHVLDLMKRIKSKQGKIAIVTDGRSITQRNKIKKLGLETWIDHLVISEEIGSEKPNPVNFIHVENHFNALAYTYIADNLKKDFVAPNKLKWNTIAKIDNGNNIHKLDAHFNLTEKFLPKHSVSCFSEIKIIS